MNELMTQEPSASDIARSVEQVRASFIMAKKYPRDEIEALNKILTACKRLSLAKQAIYRYPRGNQDVSGPSIRLAEMLARYWGNIDCGMRELEKKDGESVMEAYCVDLEQNYRRAQTWTVKHELNTRNGKKLLTDSRDIYEKNANEGARRLRACILAVIPGDIVDQAVIECQKTVQNGGKERPLQDRVKGMVHAFSELGIPKDKIERRLGHSLDAMSHEELGDFTEIYTSLKDGITKKEDWFSFELTPVTTEM